MSPASKPGRVFGVGLSVALGVVLLVPSPASAADVQTGSAGGQVLQQQLTQRTAIVVPTGTPTKPSVTTHPATTPGSPNTSVNVNTSVTVPVVVVFNIAQQCQQTTNSCIVKTK
jgi:hypothetical protein